MILKIVSLFAICCFGSFVSGVEDPQKLFEKMFFEDYPYLTRDQALMLLKDLQDLYKDVPLSQRGVYIEQLSEKSEVSQEKCRSGIFFGGPDYQFGGHAKQLVIDTRRVQANICKEKWETSLMQLLDTLDTRDKDMVNSLVDSMIEANSGNDFATIWFEMPAKNAQQGVLRYMASKRGKFFSPQTTEAEFNEAFDRYVDEPCRKVIEKLYRVADMYVVLWRFNEIANELNPFTLRWTKNNMICLYVRGYGYSTDKEDSFRGNTFANLVGKTKDVQKKFVIPDPGRDLIEMIKSRLH